MAIQNTRYTELLTGAKKKFLNLDIGIVTANIGDVVAWANGVQVTIDLVIPNSPAAPYCEVDLHSSYPAGTRIDIIRVTPTDPTSLSDPTIAARAVQDIVCALQYLGAQNQPTDLWYLNPNLPVAPGWTIDLFPDVRSTGNVIDPNSENPTLPDESRLKFQTEFTPQTGALVPGGIGAYYSMYLNNTATEPLEKNTFATIGAFARTNAGGFNPLPSPGHQWAPQAATLFNGVVTVASSATPQKYGKAEAIVVQARHESVTVGATTYTSDGKLVGVQSGVVSLGADPGRGDSNGNPTAGFANYAYAANSNAGDGNPGFIA